MGLFRLASEHGYCKSAQGVGLRVKLPAFKRDAGSTWTAGGVLRLSTPRL